MDGYGRDGIDGKAERHEWNLVRMSDDAWYAVDVTWNDTVDGEEDADGVHAAFYLGEDASEPYLLVGANTDIYDMQFSDSHIADNYVFQDELADCFLEYVPILSEERYMPLKNSMSTRSHVVTLQSHRVEWTSYYER